MACCLYTIDRPDNRCDSQSSGPRFELPNRRNHRRSETGRFYGDLRRYYSWVLISGEARGLLGRFQPPVSAAENSVPAAEAPTAKPDWQPGLFGLFLSRAKRCLYYGGLSPRFSNCRRHSAGASRSRSTPMPRGRRPSTAALTRPGARNASEIVMLT